MQNTAPYTRVGGAMYLQTNAKPVIIACLFGKNVADRGGAIYCSDSSPEILDCTISRNAAFGTGFGICCMDDSSPTIVGCTIIDNHHAEYIGLGNGGGLFLSGGSPIIRQCTISGHYARDGGGLACGCDGAVIEDCTISENRSRGPGGGMRVSGSAIIRDCTIRNNYSSQSAGGVSCRGDVSVIDCSIRNNTARTHGAGVMLAGGAPAFVNCEIVGNDAHAHGGGVGCSEGAPSFTHCIVSGNTAHINGGGVYCESNGCPMFGNCVIVSNAAEEDGGGLYCEGGGTPVFANCVLWDNGPQQINVTDCSPTIQYCDVEGGWSGPGNISADPLFYVLSGEEEGMANYRLLPGSPCIDAGDNGAVPLDALDLDEDGDVTERLPLDPLGRPRFMNDPDTPDTGQVFAPYYLAPVDIGLYEFRPAQQDCNGNDEPDEIDVLIGTSADCDGNTIPDECELCGDLNNDDLVDYDDYLIFLSAFGTLVDGVPIEDACCDADGSGDIGMSDLAAWLACYRDFVNDPIAQPPAAPTDQTWSFFQDESRSQDRKAGRSTGTEATASPSDKRRTSHRTQ